MASSGETLTGTAIIEESSTLTDDVMEVAEDALSVLTDEETLKLFREEIQNLSIELDEYFGSDSMLIRWLRARSMNIDEATKMLKESLEWKEAAGINTILNWKPPPEFIDDFPFYICGFDNEGDPFGVVTWKKWNVEALLAALYRDGGATHLKYFYQCMEVIHGIHREHSLLLNRIVSQGIVIIDMEGLAVTQFASKEAISVLLEGTRKFEANYPGLLKKVVVVNAPTIFSMLWQIISPLLSEETKSKVEVHGYYSYNDDWKGCLRQVVPIDSLPAHYGGSNTNCKSYKPNDGYRNFQPKPANLDKHKMKTVSVAAGDKLKICLNVSKPRSVLRWEFKSDYYDVGFSVMYEDEIKEVVDYSRADSHVVLQKGVIECHRSGKYYLVFDNSFSRFRGKTVHYRSHLLEPTICSTFTTDEVCTVETNATNDGVDIVVASVQVATSEVCYSNSSE